MGLRLGNAQPSHSHSFLAIISINAQVIELIKRTPKESAAGDFISECGTLQGALALENVVFSYPIRPTHKVLNGLSMTVNPGESWLRVSSIVFSNKTGYIRQ